MSALYVRMEVLPGTDVQEAATEARDYARRFGCRIAFDFNGVECFVGPDDDPRRIVWDYHDQLGRNAKPERPKCVTSQNKETKCAS